MFFAGRLPRPPWETRARVAALVKKHDQSFIRNTADRFRFESLQNRYAKFLELWERQMTNKELGRPTLGAKRASPPRADGSGRRGPGGKAKDKHKDEKHKDEKHKDEKHKTRSRREVAAKAGVRRSRDGSLRARPGPGRRSREAALRAAGRSQEAGRRKADCDRSARRARQGAGRQVRRRRERRRLQGRLEGRQGAADGEAGRRKEELISEAEGGRPERTRTGAGREPGTGWIKR